MKRINVLTIIIGAILMLSNNLSAQVGYYDAPYVRYEADQGTLTNATATAKSFRQSDLQSEASEQICVNLSNSGAAVSWPVTSDGDGLVVRYCIPDGQSAVLEVFANNVSVGTLNLTTYYSWEYLSSNGNPNNAGVTNTNPKMRFDEVRMKLPSQILAGGNLKIARQSGNNIYLDFAELESVPAAVGFATGNVTYTGNGSDLQAFINGNPGRVIYMPAGVYNVNNELYFGQDNTSLKGAGMWYTQINFTNGNGNQGGLRANANNISYSGLYLTTARNSRSNSYKAINGVYTGGSLISNVWAEHFECGAWIGQYNTGGPGQADGFTVSNCRFRNNYADGINLCKGTRNTIVEHCNFRNNGDDDMAIWSADNMECQNNTFRYNTSENCWRASGCAIYGGYNNKAYNLLIQDNLEVGIKVNNAFGGAGFNGGGMHEFSNIIIKRCGTYNDLFNKPVGAIDLGVYNNGAGTRVQNVKFSCIVIQDSKNDAIYINKNAGDGFYNMVFENITIDGTGREYPNNDAGNVNGARGFGILFRGSPAGNGTYCGMTYSNRGGNATMDVNTSAIGSFSWNAAGSCPSGCSLLSGVTITSPANGASLSGGCSAGPYTIAATAIPPAGKTVTVVEFFIDGVSIGTDNSFPYSISWNNPTEGTHTITAVASYSGGGSSTSSAVSVTVGGGIRQAVSSPNIDGSIDAVWDYYAAYQLTQGFNNPPNLGAYFKIMYDATNLYVLIDVSDNDLKNPDPADIPNYWHNDGVEIYIDIGNDKKTFYDNNDYQYALVWNKGNLLETKHGATAGVSYSQTTKVGGLGYIMEFSFPWSTLTGSPTQGTSIGFDVKLNDDDGAAGRDNQLAWKDGSFGAYNNPSLFGTLQFLNCGPLPVSLLSFKGETRNNSVVLDWVTTSEQNNEKFVIERSADLQQWKEIGEVAATGSETSITSYSYTDYNFSGRMVYYRLRQVDLDGKYVYSNALLVRTSNIAQVSVLPNPFEQELTILNNHKGAIDISISDVLGRTLFHTNSFNTEEKLVIQPELSPGVYVITIKTDEVLEQQTIIRK